MTPCSGTFHPWASGTLLCLGQQGSLETARALLLPLCAQSRHHSSIALLSPVTRMQPQNPGTGLLAATGKGWPWKHHLLASSKGPAGPAKLLPAHRTKTGISALPGNRGSHFPQGWVWS